MSGEIVALGVKAYSDGVKETSGDLDGLTEAAKGAEAATQKLDPATRKAGAGAADMGDKARKAAEGAKKLGDDTRTTEGALARLARSVGGGVNGALRSLSDFAGSALGKLTALAAAALSINSLKTMADGWSDMQSVVGAATKDMDGAAATMRRLADLAAASYSPLEQTARGFAANATILRELGYSTQQMLDYTEALNHALVINAAKGENAAVVQNALGRALATGKLQATEYEVIMSRSPRVLEAIAKQMGTNVSELRRLGSEGKITGETIGRALTGELQNLRREAGNMPATIGDAFTLIGNSLLEVIGVFDQAGQISSSLADQLVDLSKWIRSLADIDFAAWADTATGALTLLAQAALVLAATRVPALLISVRGLAGAFTLVGAQAALMRGQFLAGAVASRAMTVAMGAQAVAARGLGMAMALVGGPVGLAAAALAAVGMAMYNNRAEADPLSGALEAVARSQRDLNAALREYENTGTGDALQAARKAADETVVRLQDALKAAEIEMQRARANIDLAGPGDFGMGALFSEERQAGLNAMIAKVQQIRQELSEAVGVQGQLNAAWEKAAASLGVAVEKLTAEQLKAFEMSQDLITTFERRAELARIETKHGRDSAQYLAEQLSQERAIQFAKIAALDISEKQRAAARDAYDLMMKQEAATKGWIVQVNGVNKALGGAHSWLLKIRDTEPGGGWLDTAISKAAGLAAQLWEAVAANDLLVSKAPPKLMDDRRESIISNRRGVHEAAGFTRDRLRSEADRATRGGGGAGDDRSNRLSTLLDSLRTEEEALAIWRTTQLEEIAKFSELELAAIGGKHGAIERLELEHQERLRGLRGQEQDAQLAGYSSFFGALAGIASSGGSRLLKISATFGAIQGTIDAYGAYLRALNSPIPMTPWGRAAAALNVLGAGLKGVAAIRAAGGAGGGGGSANAVSAAAAQPQASPQQVIIDTNGSALMRQFINEQVIPELQKASKNGVIIVGAK